MNKKHFLVALLLLQSFSIFSQRSEKQASQKPTLVVGIVVEQMRYDYLMRFWDKFGEGGFKKLIIGGTSCRQATIDYMYPQTNAGYATIVSGANPRSHGIIADEWYDRIKNKIVTASTDEMQTTISGFDKDITVSPARLSVSTIGDELKLANKFSKVISVSCKPSAAVMLAGHSADGAYWLDEGSGEWTTSSYYRTDLPQWIKDFNAKKYADIYMTKTWSPLFPIDKYTDCLPDKNEYEIGINTQTTFPYQLPALTDTYKKYKILKTTPFGNSFTKDFAIYTIAGENLGKDQNPDLLMVSFSATENIGYRFGPRSIEIEDTYLRLDKDIEFLLQYIEKEVGKYNTLVFLTSTSGTADNTKQLNDQKIQAGQFKQVKAEQLLKSYLNAVYGENDWVSYYGKQTFFLNQTLLEDKKIPLTEIQEKSANFLVKLTGVSQVFTSNILLNTNFTEGVQKQIYNSFNQKRSGDIFLNLEPGWIEQTTTEATAHNSPYYYDTHVPLIWYGWKVEHLQLTKAVSLTDIAPTISAVLKIAEPNACTGKPIWEIMINE
jgi:predicted AlkP superfamily pyrophosphatase or phosphodiesterase